MKNRFRILFVCASGLVANICSQGPKVQVNPSPAADLSSVTDADIIKTMEHRDALSQQRIAELTEENNGLVKSNQALAKQLNDLRADDRAVNTIVAVGPDLSKQVDALNGDISSLKHQLFIARWKWTIIGVLVGIVAAIAAFLFTKAAVVVTSIAAKVGIKAAV